MDDVSYGRAPSARSLGRSADRDRSRPVLMQANAEGGTTPAGRASPPLSPRSSRRCAAPERPAFGIAHRPRRSSAAARSTVRTPAARITSATRAVYRRTHQAELGDGRHGAERRDGRSGSGPITPRRFRAVLFRTDRRGANEHVSGIQCDLVQSAVIRRPARLNCHGIRTAMTDRVGRRMLALGPQRRRFDRGLRRASGAGEMREARASAMSSTPGARRITGPATPTSRRSGVIVQRQHGVAMPATTTITPTTRSTVGAREAEAAANGSGRRRRGSPQSRTCRRREDVSPNAMNDRERRESGANDHHQDADESSDRSCRLRCAARRWAPLYTSSKTTCWDRSGCGARSRFRPSALEAARVITAVARGDLSQKMVLQIDGPGPDLA